MGTAMRKLHYILLVLVCFVQQLSYAQDLPLTNEAARYCQEKNYDLAQTKINAALESGEARHAYTWYVHGFIQKEIYKERESTNRKSKHRELALESFLKCLDRDKKAEYSEMCKAGIKYLATTYFNDAQLRTRDFDSHTANEPEELFALFRKYMRTADPVFPIKTFEKEFATNMAQRYFTLWQLNVDREEYAEKSLSQYAHALRLDSTDNDVYYNIAVIYYNKAVFKYRKIDANTDFIELLDIQQECANLIKNQALVNMNKAYVIDPDRPDVIRGLLYIHRALEHEQDVEYFKAEIERLVNNGTLNEPFKRE
jgi:hypothetical protein